MSKSARGFSRDRARDVRADPRYLEKVRREQFDPT